jgi:deoxyribodipyrimidine photo-lyase
LSSAVVLFTRDLRVDDNPSLGAALREFERVVPLFVLDPAFARSRRDRFLAGALRHLDGELRQRGGRLVLRRGETVAETVRVARECSASTVFLASDASAYAQARAQRLGATLELRVGPGITVVPMDQLATAEGTHYRVFTPYWRSWQTATRRPLEAAPERVTVPDVEGEPLPEGDELDPAAAVRRWVDGGLGSYERLRGLLAADGTSRLSPHLHFGTISPLALAREADARGAVEFVRQLCWRDFYAQLLFHQPELAHDDLHPRGDDWNDDEDGIAAWREGRTGIPIVDAGMRQLAAEGWMHNRARLITASFLVKDLYVDWRLGARHYADELLDGDVANNAGNWQWVAGSGVDPRPYRRIYNPTLQARRHDPDGDYVRRYVPELAELDAAAIHEPWKLGERRLRELGYPPPVVDHTEAARRFRARRGRDTRQLAF